MDDFPINLVPGFKAPIVLEKLLSINIRTPADLISRNPHELQALLAGKEEGHEYDLSHVYESSKKFQRKYDTKFADLFLKPDPRTSLLPARLTIPFISDSGSAGNPTKQQIIAALNDVVGLGEVTHIYGVPGTGKTTLSIQIACAFLKKYQDYDALFMGIHILTLPNC
jgi:hypothetical protein